MPGFGSRKVAAHLPLSHRYPGRAGLWARFESLERPQTWPLDGDLIMFISRRIERHQLPCFLQVFNRLTDKPIGYLGNVSAQGLMLISQLPMMVGVEFE